MARAPHAKSPGAITISRRWQMAFVGAVGGTELINIGFFIWMMTRSGRPSVHEVWMYQVSFWVYPLLYAAIALLFVWRRATGTLPRLFWTAFVATIGYLAYMALQSFVQVVQLNFMSDQYNSYGTSSGWWTGPALQWTEMAVGLLLYCSALCFIIWRSKRR